MPMARVLGFLGEEIRSLLRPTLFFMLGFNLITFTNNLVLAEYGIHLVSFALAATAALIVGKAVLVADTMPFVKRYDDAPLILPIVYKTAIYTLVVMVFRVIEKIVGYWIESGALDGVLHHLRDGFSWHRFAATQIWIVVLFLVYVTATELDALFGQGELRRIFFHSAPSEMRTTRRQRLRCFAALGRLVRGHREEELRDRNSAAHAELFRLVGTLAAQPAPARSQPGAALP